MSEIWIHRYVLRSKSPGNRHSSRTEFPGALLRMGAGFACLHPWPELGDLPLDDQLEMLKGGGRKTVLIERALECARIDGAAREKGVSLFGGLCIPESHWLWNSGIDTDIQLAGVVGGGFGAVKVKCGGVEEDAARMAQIASGLPDGVLLRPDLNGALDADSFGKWVGMLPEEVRGRIDFLEDPLDFDPDLWRKLAAEYEIEFALDFGGVSDGKSEGAYRWRVIKPAVDDPDAVAGENSEAGLVFTSYLDHPFGQVFAAYCAGRAVAAGKREVGRCGLVSQLWFEPSQFGEALGVENGGRLAVPDGSGLGFGELLERLPWTKL